jgi:hypothetical protein
VVALLLCSAQVPLTGAGKSGGGGSTAPTAWSVPDKVNTTLTNANLTATGAGGTGSGRAVVSPSSGKFYWEFTFVTQTVVGTGAGFGSTGAALPINTAGAGATGLNANGGIYVNGSLQTSISSRSNGDIIGVAIDVGAKIIWYRLAPSGNWNGSGTANPATGAGGFDLSSLTFPIIPSYFIANTNVITANFGGTAFSGAVPAGFASGCCGP